jgi:hypothetical protein
MGDPSFGVGVGAGYGTRLAADLGRTASNVSPDRGDRSSSHRQPLHRSADRFSHQVVKRFTTTTAVVVVEPVDMDLRGGTFALGKRLHD